MGTYYLVHCPEKRERIDPQRLGDGGIKFYAVVLGPTATLAMYAVISQRWPSFHVLGDGGDEYDEVKESHTDVTERLVEAFNSDLGRSFPEGRIELREPEPDSVPPEPAGKGKP